MKQKRIAFPEIGAVGIGSTTLKVAEPPNYDDTLIDKPA
jgi:hypothetical protein